MFLRVDLGDWNIIEKYFRTIKFTGLSAEVLCFKESGLKLIFHQKAYLLISFKSLFKGY